MYKWLLSFIVAFIVAALIISHCSDEQYDLDNEDDIEAFPSSENESSLGLETNDNVMFDENDVDNQSSTIENDLTGLEIPCLTKQLSEHMLSRVGYTVSYNVSSKNPNWVAWHLAKDHTTGSVSRHGYDYADDIEVKGYVPREDDWYNMPSTLSHVHMCPAGDNEWDKKAMEQTFLLSNMCPQTQKLNSGSWNKLEEKCRE